MKELCAILCRGVSCSVEAILLPLVLTTGCLGGAGATNGTEDAAAGVSPGGAAGVGGTTLKDGTAGKTSADGTASEGGTAGAAASEGGTAGAVASEGGAAGAAASEGGAAGAAASEGGAAGVAAITDCTALQTYPDCGTCEMSLEAYCSGQSSCELDTASVCTQIWWGSDWKVGCGYVRVDYWGDVGDRGTEIWDQGTGQLIYHRFNGMLSMGCLPDTHVGTEPACDEWTDACATGGAGGAGGVPG